MQFNTISAADYVINCPAADEEKRVVRSGYVLFLSYYGNGLYYPEIRGVYWSSAIKDQGNNSANTLLAYPDRIDSSAPYETHRGMPLRCLAIE